MDLLVMFKSLDTLERRRSFRLASEELIVDQSTLNKRIKRLEAYYNTELVIRNGNKINMTTAAKSILYKYREIQEILTDVETKIMQLENYQIATSSDILIHTEISEHLNDNVHVCDDYDELIKRFNDGTYREILVENRFDEQINYGHKELFTTIETAVIGSLNLPDELSIDELIKNCQLIGNRYDPFARTASYYLKELKDFDYEKEAILVDCQQEVLYEIMNNENYICIVPTVLILNDRLRTKVKTIKITDFNLVRSIYSFKH